MAGKGSENIDKSSSNDAVPGRVEQILSQLCSSMDKHTLADVLCPICDEFQCAQCSNVLTTQLVDSKEITFKPDSFDMIGLDQCEEHKKVLEFFCEDENQLFCSTCAIVGHRKCHSVVEFKKIAEKSGSTRSKLKVRLQKALANAETVIKNMKTPKERLNQDVEELSLKVRRMRDGVRKMFDDLEISVAKDAESLKTESLDKLAKKQENCEKFIGDATKSQETIDNVYRDGTPSQQFIVEQTMAKQVNELYSKFEEECQSLETATVSFDFDETLKLPPSPTLYYVPGQLTLKYTLLKGAKPIGPVDSIVKLTKFASIDLKQTGNDIKEPLYTGLDFLPDGRLVAVDNENMKCLIYNEKLEKVGSYLLLYIPQGVVAVSEEEVAITSNSEYKIDFLHVSKATDITLERTCDVTKEYDSICMKDDRHFVVGTIDDTIPIRIVSL